MTTRAIAAIRVEFIDHANQRYPTAGDWLYEGDVLVLRISRTKDERHQQLVAIHEMAEALICNQDGVTAEAVDAFDMGPGEALADPGASPDAPYHGQHMIATAIERVMASAMRVDWREYDMALERLE